MQISRINLLILLVGSSFLFTSCKKKESTKTYEVNAVDVLPSSAGKNKEKTNQQYVAILHANLFQQALPADEQYEISQVFESIGSKEVAKEVLISNFLNESDVILPTEEEMLADLDKFIVDTYRRFLIRMPSEAEITYFRNFINSDPNVTPELVYFAFALSNEYQFY